MIYNTEENIINEIKNSENLEFLNNIFSIIEKRRNELLNIELNNKCREFSILIEKYNINQELYKIYNYYKCYDAPYEARAYQNEDCFEDYDYKGDDFPEEVNDLLINICELYDLIYYETSLESAADLYPGQDVYVYINSKGLLIYKNQNGDDI